MEASTIETHPFVPFLPGNARLLMLGTFPPAPKRWSMAWYYPNFTNDMWRIFGLIFFGDKQHFVCQEKKTYRLDALKAFLTQRGVALFDTCLRIRRTTGTASDKDLEVVEQADLDGMLRALPCCRAGSDGRPTGYPNFHTTLWHRHQGDEDGRLPRVLLRGSHDPPLPHAEQQPRLPHADRGKGCILRTNAHRPGHQNIQRTIQSVSV